MWTLRDLRTLVLGRSSDGGIWECRGTVVALGNGRVLAGVVGVEEVVLASPVRAIGQREWWSLFNKKDPGLQPLVLPGGEESVGRGSISTPLTHSGEMVTRSSLFYTLPDNGERMDVFRYRPTAPPRRVRPILSPVRRVTVGVDAEGRLVMERGGAKTVIEEGPKEVGERGKGGMAAGWSYVGRARVPKKGVKGKVPTTGGVERPGSLERFGYVLGKGRGVGGVFTWSRVGRCPSWYGGGMCVTYLEGVRVGGGLRNIDGKIRTWMGAVGRGDGLAKQLRGGPLKSGRSSIQKAEGGNEDDAIVVSPPAQRRSPARAVSDIQVKAIVADRAADNATSRNRQGSKEVVARRRKFMGLF